MTHTSALCHPHPSHLLPSPSHCASHLHMSASHWRCPSCLLEALSNLSGLAYTRLKMPPLSSATHAPFLPHCAALRRLCLCLWALQYLMAGPTCHHCDIQVCPICLSNLAGTIWPDSLHVDRWTIVGWMFTHTHNSQA